MQCRLIYIIDIDINININISSNNQFESCLLLAGVSVAYACAFILKRFQLAPGADSRQGGLAFNATIYEIALVVMSAYLSYLLSESLSLSGIVTLFFTGICHAHYSYYSVTKEAAITLKRFFEFAAFLSEMFVFAYLGLQVCFLVYGSSCSTGFMQD